MQHVIWNSKKARFCFYRSRAKKVGKQVSPQAKLQEMCWFQLLKCDHLQIFSLLYHLKLNILGVCHVLFAL